MPRKHPVDLNDLQKVLDITKTCGVAPHQITRMLGVNKNQVSDWSRGQYSTSEENYLKLGYICELAQSIAVVTGPDHAHDFFEHIFAELGNQTPALLIGQASGLPAYDLKALAQSFAASYVAAPAAPSNARSKSSSKQSKSSDRRSDKIRVTRASNLITEIVTMGLPRQAVCRLLKCSYEALDKVWSEEAPTCRPETISKLEAIKAICLTLAQKWPDNLEAVLWSTNRANGLKGESLASLLMQWDAHSSSRANVFARHFTKHAARF